LKFTVPACTSIARLLGTPAVPSILPNVRLPSGPRPLSPPLSPPARTKDTAGVAITRSGKSRLPAAPPAELPPPRPPLARMRLLTANPPPSRIWRFPAVPPTSPRFWPSPPSRTTAPLRKLSPTPSSMTCPPSPAGDPKAPKAEIVPIRLSPALVIVILPADPPRAVPKRSRAPLLVKLLVVTVAPLRVMSPPSKPGVAKVVVVVDPSGNRVTTVKVPLIPLTSMPEPMIRSPSASKSTDPPAASKPVGLDTSPPNRLISPAAVVVMRKSWPFVTIWGRISMLPPTSKVLPLLTLMLPPLRTVNLVSPETSPPKLIALFPASRVNS